MLSMLKTSVIPEIGQSDQGREDPIAMPRLNHHQHPMLMSYHPRGEKVIHHRSQAIHQQSQDIHQSLQAFHQQS